MTHNHKEECKHEKLTYCKEYDVVECECGREWNKWKVEPITPLPEVWAREVWERWARYTSNRDKNNI